MSSVKRDPGDSGTGWADWLRRTGGLALVLVLGLLLVAAADEPDREMILDIDTVVRDVDAGTVVLLTDPPVDVSSDLVGRECTVVAQSENQSSVHPDNDLLVETGDASVLIEGVEAEPGGTVNASGTVVMGSEISVSLLMGPDEVFSAGIEVTVDCAAGATTTTEATTTTTEATTTTAEVSDTEVTTTEQASTTTTEDVSGADDETTTTEDDQAIDDDEVAGESTTSSIEDEVLGTEVLPFTGPVTDNLGLIAMWLVAVGTLVLAASWKNDHHSTR